LANAIVARILQPSGYGILAFLTIAYAAALAVAELGMPYAMVQWGAAADARGNGDAARDLISRSVGFRLLVQYPATALVGVWLLLAHPLLLPFYLAITFLH